jgi:hypothetical protein
MLPLDMQTADAAVVAARADYDAAVADQQTKLDAQNAAQNAKTAADEVVTTCALRLNNAVDAAEGDLEHFRPGQTPSADAPAPTPISDTVPI